MNLSNACRPKVVFPALTSNGVAMTPPPLVSAGSDIIIQSKRQNLK